MLNKKIYLALIIFCFPLFVHAEVFTEASNIEELTEYVSDGKSVKLTSNIDISETGLVILEGSSVTIDLNGFEISVISEYNQNIRVSEGAALTIMDSSVNKTGKVYSFGALQNNGRGVIDVNGVFTLESGTIESILQNYGTGFNTNAIVVSKENKEAIFNEEYTAKVIINGGVINSLSYAITNHNSFGGNTKIIVNGGVINSEYYGIYSTYTNSTVPGEHDVVITGGVINSGLNSIVILSSDYAYEDASHSKNVVPDLTITGGTFTTGTGYDAISFQIYNDTDVTEEDILKYFDVQIENAKFSSDPSIYKKYYTTGWFLESNLVNNYYVLEKISLDNSNYEEPTKVETPTVYIKNFNSVNEIIFSSIGSDAEIAGLLLNAENSPTVEININEASSVSGAVISEMQSLVGNASIVTYFDISVLLTIDDFEKNLENLNEEIELSIKLPEEYTNIDDKTTRTYYVIREHDGIVEKIDSSLDGDDLSFKTDKFSVYALAYEDIKNPETNDNLIIFIGIAGVSLIGIVTVLKLKKTENK